MDLFSKFQKPLIQAIEKAVADKRDAYADVNPWGGTAADLLSQFAIRGKLIRGSLVLFAEEMFSGKISEDGMRLAVALEFIHSGLLIHDDIMDNDPLRRGKPSVHKQFEAQLKGVNAEHFGRSLAACTGDLAYFLAGELQSLIQNPHAHLITQKIFREISYVNIAQMQDVTYVEGVKIDEQQILRTYKYKTGRYSISLPLVIGAMLQDQSRKVIEQLESFGEKTGILFQLTDDTLSIFGKKEITGKLLGTDIKENKKTIYRALLLKAADKDEIKQLESIFGNSELEEKDITYVVKIIKKYAIDDAVFELCKKYEQEATEIINELPVESTYKKQLKTFVTSLRTRNK